MEKNPIWLPANYANYLQMQYGLVYVYYQYKKHNS